uniref:Uncharacterized protein n=1 Tax=Picea sitchensis TaxID=3332 RepID=D5AA60_PICSI|nr:unknown [Picea sitchensis]
MKTGVDKPGVISIAESREQPGVIAIPQSREHPGVIAIPKSRGKVHISMICCLEHVLEIVFKAVEETQDLHLGLRLNIG